jgi:hypothetical protein
MKEILNFIKQNNVLVLKGIKSKNKKDFFKEIDKSYTVIYTSSSNISVEYYKEKTPFVSKDINHVVGILKSEKDLTLDYDIIVYDRIEEDSLNLYKIFKLWDRRFNFYTKNPKLIFLTNSEKIPYFEDVRMIDVEDNVNYNFKIDKTIKEKGKSIVISDEPERIYNDIEYDNKILFNNMIEKDYIDYLLETKDDYIIVIDRTDLLSLYFKNIDNIYDTCYEKYYLKSFLNKETEEFRPSSIENLKNTYNYILPTNYYIFKSLEELSSINISEMITRDLTKFNIDIGNTESNIIKHCYFNTNLENNCLTDFGIFSMYYNLSLRNCGILYDWKGEIEPILIATSISDSSFEDITEFENVCKNFESYSHQLNNKLKTLSNQFNTTIYQYCFEKDTLIEIISLYLKYFYDYVYTYNLDKYISNDNKIIENCFLGNKIIVLDYNEKITLYINLDKYS